MVGLKADHRSLKGERKSIMGRFPCLAITFRRFRKIRRFYPPHLRICLY
jgi:hypothetical protein